MKKTINVSIVYDNTKIQASYLTGDIVNIRGAISLTEIHFCPRCEAMKGIEVVMTKPKTAIEYTPIKECPICFKRININIHK